MMSASWWATVVVLAMISPRLAVLHTFSVIFTESVPLYPLHPAGPVRGERLELNQCQHYNDKHSQEH